MLSRGLRKNPSTNFNLISINDGLKGGRPELVGGGLIRSLGGWFEVLALRRRDVKEASDQRILGDGDFVEQVPSESQDLTKENMRNYVISALMFSAIIYSFRRFLIRRFFSGIFLRPSADLSYWFPFWRLSVCE